MAAQAEDVGVILVSITGAHLHGDWLSSRVVVGQSDASLPLPGQWRVREADTCLGSLTPRGWCDVAVVLHFSMESKWS